jgi:stage II sporulation protein D
MTCYWRRVRRTLGFLFFSSSLFAQQVEQDKQIDIFLDAGQYLEAVAYCADMASGLSGNESAGYLQQQGDLYLNYLDMPERAKKMYRTVLDVYPTSSYADDAAYNLGMILYQAGENHQAQAYFERILSQHPKSPKQNNARFMVERIHSGHVSPKKQQEKIGRKQQVRVLLMRGRAHLKVTSQDGFTLLGGGQTYQHVSRQVIIRQIGNSVRIAGHSLSLPVVLKPRSGLFVFNGRSFPGSMILAQNSGDLLVINHVDIESYLKGVVPKEMGANWPLEALKAQAVASRTFVLYQASKRKSHAFDVRATTASQVYGEAVKDSEASRAVDVTRGQVLTHQGRPILAYFHAHSGGYVEDDGQVFPVDLPYLNAQKDQFSLQSTKRRYTWSATVPASTLLGLVGGEGVLRDIRVSSRTASGRVGRLIVSWLGKSQTVDAARLRLKLDPRKLKSTWFDVRKKGDHILFEGQGYGHGVGMSQWGAKAMAKTHDYVQILHYYYPNTQMTTLIP